MNKQLLIENYSRLKFENENLKNKIHETDPAKIQLLKKQNLALNDAIKKADKVIQSILKDTFIARTLDAVNIKKNILSHAIETICISEKQDPSEWLKLE